MLAFRLIARLDIKGEHLIKTYQLDGVRKIGNPQEYAERYDAEGIDEILYLDVVASLYGRNHLCGLLTATADKCFVPLTAAGGVNSVDDVRQLLLAGADKVAVNTGAIKRPELISEIANKFGSQCMVIQIDAKKRGNGYEAYCDGGRQPTGKDAIDWAREAVERGAGEILLTSIDREGMGGNPDISLLSLVARDNRVPIVYSGGIGTPDEIVSVAKQAATGAAMAGSLHFNRFRISDAKSNLARSGIPIRPCVS